MKSRINVLKFLIVVAIFAGVSSCKKEEPLSPRNDLAGAQQYDININPNDTTIGGIGGGNGGGTGGGSVAEFFSASVNGTGANFDTYSYTDNGSSVIFSGTNSGNQHKINFSIIGSLSTGQSLDLTGFPNSASYRGTAATQLISKRGTLYIDTVGSNFIRGTFFFDAINQNNPTDSVRITTGIFQMEI